MSIISQKYFRTPHTPWSMGGTADDEKTTTVDHMLNVEIEITSKLDGQNETLTNTSVFARSHAQIDVHPSAAWAKAVHGSIRHLIDPGLSVFVEYTYALHSIWYRRMVEEQQYLHVIGVRDDSTGIHWSVDDVQMMADVLGLPRVPVLFRGIVRSQEELRRLMPGDGKSPCSWGGVPIRMVDGKPIVADGHDLSTTIREGEVARVTGAFSDASVSVIKSVRAGHVATDALHWKKHWIPMDAWKP